ncbi:MAG TPA: D-alanyl-D-alanine carboxypeptidase/D-alanyl-D-alanine-endopeptidase [Acidimicrobiia bacterium]|nr:D-alanyl-D-alanine carboxypeptidase/D-alanyl-D-alanine-endopeptidase [Acidimicrobiia bacterium]
MTRGHDTLRRIIAFVLVAAAFGCAYVAFRDDNAPAASTTKARLATPLWSPRRIPQPIVDAVGAQRLQASLDAEVGTGQTCVAANAGSGDIASHNSTLALTPASTQKLLTSAAALSTMGPGFKYETKGVAASDPANGTVERLWLVGAGDPSLSTPDYQAMVESNPRRDAEEQATGPSKSLTSLASLADAIVAGGVRNIPGGVQGDDSRYEALRYLPSWDPTYRTDPEIGAISALTVNHGINTVQPRLTPVDDPAVFAATKLSDLLRARGVSVGQPGRSTAPNGAKTIGSVQSAPLRDLVGAAIESSDNLAMEMFAREIGLKATNQGTTAAGAKAIVDRIHALGVQVDGVTLVDGSGLDYGNRVSCQALLSALALGTRPEFNALRDGLAVAGQTGTLADEFRGSSLAGKLRGKTGSLSGVTGLAGFVDNGRPVLFSYIANGGFGRGAGVAMRARIAQIVGTFPDAPAPDQLVPVPNPPVPSTRP